MPDIDEKANEQEQEDALAVYIMAFGKLQYGIMLKTINKIMLDEKLMQQFKSMPIPTLARECVKLTEFTEKEKEKYRNSQEIVYTHFPCEHLLRAYNKGTNEHLPEFDKPLNQLEEDYYFGNLLTPEEYQWCKFGRLESKPQPINMRYKFTEAKLGESEYAKTQRAKVRS